jgi:transposase
VIQLPAGTRIWIAAGVTDMRRGFDGLSAQVQTVLHEQPFSGHIFIFRGRRGDIVKCLWFDGDGLWLAQKRLSKGRFTWWPESTSAAKQLEAYEAQLLMVAGDVSRVRVAPMWRRVSELK